MPATPEPERMPRAHAPNCDRTPAGSAPEQRLTKGERTRLRILRAARRAFAEVGYERATIRAIAAAAEVDKSSVIQHFGSKQGLFEESVRWHIPFERYAGPEPAATVENLMRGMLGNWAADPHTPMAVLLRASMTSEEAARALRERVTREAVDQLAQVVDAPDARLRAGLFAAIMMGIASHRHLLHMPDIAQASTDDVLRVMTPVLKELVAPEPED